MPTKYDPRVIKKQQEAEVQLSGDVPEYQDFSPFAAARRDFIKGLEHKEALREVNKQIANLNAEPDEQPSRGGVSRKNLAIAHFEKTAQDLAEDERRRQARIRLDRYPAMKRILDIEREQGNILTSEDIEQLVDFSVLNDAADTVFAGIQARDPNAAKNVILTLQETNPYAAALLPDVVNEKLVQSIEDPTLLAMFTEQLANVLGTIFSPFVAANEWVMAGIEAGNYRSARSPLGETPLSWISNAQGFVSAEDRAAVAPGRLNEEYLSELAAQKNTDGTPKYTPLQLEIVTEIVRREAKGDPMPIASLWQDRYTGDLEAAKVFGDLVYNRASGNTQELYRQVQSANLSDIGSSMLGAALPDVSYSDFRGTETRENIADVTGMATQVVYDPTNLVFGVGRAYQAAKWSLDRLAPGAMRAATVLQPVRLAGVNVSPAYRFFDNFTKDLNRLDRFDEAAAKATAAGDTAKANKIRTDAAAFRNRMTRQYDEMPEQLIEDFRTSMPKNKDGLFDVETAAKWIDDTNDAFIALRGGIAPKLAEIGAADAAKRAALLKILETTPDPKAARKAEEALGRLDDETRAQVDPLMRELQNAQDATFVARVGGSSQRYTPLIPRMSVAASVRKNAVNALKVAFSSSKTVDRMIDKYLPVLDDSGRFAEDLSANATALGEDVRQYRAGGVGNPFSGPADSIGRMASSLPDVGVLNITDASSTKAFYRLSRAFFPKRVSDLLAEEWRKGDPGSRRKMLNGVIRGAAAVRGLGNLSDDQLAEILSGIRITGTRPGERYAVSVVGGILPSQKAAMVAAGMKPEDIAAQADETLSVSLSADANGIQHALHLDDTADFVRIPTMREFEDARMTQGLLAQGYHMAGVGAEYGTDFWSFLTLYGLRFGLRNAIEEDAIFVAMGGGVKNLAKGRAADQAIRRARPRWFVEMPKSADENPVVVRRSNLGMVANKLEWMSLKMQDSGKAQWLAEFIYNAVNKNDALLAAQAHAAGDGEALAKLVAKSQVAHKLGVRNLSILSEDEMRGIERLVESQHGMQLYDQVAEASKYQNTGGFPAFVADTESINGPTAGIGWGKIRGSKTYRFGDYANVKPIQVDPATGKSILGVSFWWVQLRKTLDGDGPIGEAAVRLINKPDKAKAEIARIIREDTEYGYKERFSRISDDMAVDEFANVYFENVFQHFTKSDGTLNLQLARQFLTDDPETGKMVASFWRPSETGKNGQTFAVTMGDLEAVKVTDRPEFVFGRMVEEAPYVPVAQTEAAFWSRERGYSWMGRQNARLSKSPIFLANFLESWTASAPARKAMAEDMARAVGRTTPNEDDILLAERLYQKTAADQAYNLTMSFVDNPANRSNLAWKARNVSRYYRATEDFWRRLKRIAANRPEAFWKIALTYHVLTDTGFVYQDDEGTAYFGYPGNEQLQQAIARVGSSLFGMQFMDYMDTNPIAFTQKLSGMTPSTDLNQQLPTIMGPAAVGLVGVFNAFPALYKMKGLQKILLGEYSDVTGDMFADVIRAATPAKVLQALRTTDPEQLDASLAQGGMDALAIMTAEGLLDEVTIDGKTMPGALIRDAAQFKQTDEYQAAQMIGVAAFITRTMMTFAAPAAPGSVSNTVSDTARDLGIMGMKPLYRKLLDIHKDDPDPFASAFSEFVAMQTKKMKAGENVSLESFIPFTASTYKADDKSPDANVAALAGVRAVTDVTAWWKDEKTKDLVRNGYRNAALFLAPRQGEFDWTAWTLIKNDPTLRLQVKKSEDEMLLDLIALQGRAIDTQIRRSIEEQIAAIDPASPTAREQIAALKDQEKLERDAVKSLIPAWELVAGQGDDRYKQANYRSAFSGVRDMLTYMRERDGSLTGTAQQLQNAIDIYLHYEAQATAIQGPAAQRNAAKKQVEAQMTAELLAIKEADPGAAVFIEAVIENLGYKPDDPRFGAN